MKGGSLLALQSQADILKRAVIIVVAGQANVGFLCNSTGTPLKCDASDPELPGASSHSIQLATSGVGRLRHITAVVRFHAWQCMSMGPCSISAGRELLSDLMRMILLRRASSSE